MKHPNPEMLLRIAQGDAYCMATEYIRLPRDQAVFDAAKKFEAYVRHPVHMLDAGMYTDDTQMSVAVAEQLVSGQELSKQSFADHFMKAFLRDRRDGYSRGFQAILERCSTGEELLSQLDPSSTKNGAAMRSVPLGVITDIDTMLDVAKIQASVTHDTPDGIVSSQSIAYLSWWGMHTDEPFNRGLDRLAGAWEGLDKIFIYPWEGPVKDMTAKGGFDVGLNTVWAVATLLREQSTLMGILDQVIEWGGDTDSVAAIAWGIASSRMHEQLPEFLERDLEPHGSFGAQFLRDLGGKLMERYGEG